MARAHAPSTLSVPIAGRDASMGDAAAASGYAPCEPGPAETPSRNRGGAAIAMRKILFQIAYDGTAFHGWQKQPGRRTVQGEIACIMQRVLGHPARLVGASRTDAGVHARGQFAAVDTESPIPAENLLLATNDRLPTDIALTAVREAPAAFHATRDAQEKLYRYTLWTATRRPVTQRPGAWAWHVWTPLDLAKMAAAARLCCGTHDFAGFASQGSPRATTVRTIRNLSVRRRGDCVLLDFIGDGFLYNQVRNMVGTLVEIARGVWPVDRVREVFAGADRRLAGPTAPAQGLCLQWVRYPPTVLEVDSRPPDEHGLPEEAEDVG